MSEALADLFGSISLPYPFASSKPAILPSSTTAYHQDSPSHQISRSLLSGGYCL